MKEDIKRNFKFKDAVGKMAFIELTITMRNGYPELTICGEYNGSHGQCYDSIKPATDLQKELLLLWRELHLKYVSPMEIDAILELCEELITEEKERIGDPTFEDFIKENGVEDALTYIRENSSFGDDHKVLALCLEEGLTLSELDSITKEGDNRLSYGGRDWLVCTDEEADQEQDEEFDRYLEDCVYPDLPENMRHYFDDEKWKRDAKFDGRGHSLARYDGHEQYHDVNGTTYYLYRQ